MRGLTDLAGATALVTGASRGIGAAVARRLGDQGCRVAIVYRDNVEAARVVADSIGGAQIFRADVSKSGDVGELVAAVPGAFGPVAILVNNAGIGRRQPPEDITEQDWDDLLDVNLKSAFLVTQTVLPGMRALPWGRIVNVGSVAAQTGGTIGLHYAASKAGLVGLTHAYAARLADKLITANVVAPALIHTDMIDDTPETRRRIPVGRLGCAEEVAEAVLMLARNPYMTGQTIGVNGGLYFTS